MRLMLFFMYLVLGGPALVVRMLIDIGFLIYDDFQLVPLREQPEFQGLALPYDVLKTLLGILEQRINHKHLYESCLTRDVLLELRGALGIHFNYADLAIAVAEIQMGGAHGVEISSSKLDQFSRVKDYILQNSYQVGQSTYKLYPGIFVKTIEEVMQRLKRAQKELQRNKSLLQLNRPRPTMSPILKERGFWDSESRPSIASKKKGVELKNNESMNFDSVSD